MRSLNIACLQTIDLILGALLLFGAYKGYRQGLALVIVNTLALFIAVIVSIRFLDTATHWLRHQIDANQFILPVLAFGLLFGITYYGLWWFGSFTSKTIRYTMLGAVDQAAGAVVGLFRMAFILSSVILGIQMLGVKIRLPENELVVYPALVALGPIGFGLLSPLLPFLKKLI